MELGSAPSSSAGHRGVLPTTIKACARVSLPRQVVWHNSSALELVQRVVVREKVMTVLRSPAARQGAAVWFAYTSLNETMGEPHFCSSALHSSVNACASVPSCRPCLSRPPS